MSRIIAVNDILFTGVPFAFSQFTCN